MKKYLIIFVLFWFTNINSQNLKNEDVSGVWKVTKVLRLSNKSIDKELITSFKKAFFYFKKTQNFGLKTEHMSESFAKVTLSLIGRKWKIEGDKIYIGSEKNNYHSLIIKPFIKNKRYHFEFFKNKDLSFLLRVEKQ
ncbi:MAG TPA: hypothetical protein DDE71_08835 [Tenacibaculum sp.]|nr:hypothetical protein [Tenacibaculum sp.]